MSDFQKQSFQERIAKLEASKAANRPAADPEYRTITRERRPVWPFVMLTLGALGVIAALTLSLTNASDVIKDYAKNYMPTQDGDPTPIAAVASPDFGSSIYPLQKTSKAPNGQRLGSTLAASVHGTVVPLEMLIDLQDVATDDGSGLKLAQFERESRCVARPVLAGETVYSVNIEQPSALAPIAVRNNEDFAQSTDGPDALNGAIAPDVIEGARPGLVNVFVSDTTGPLYLVLQSFRGVVWNISPAENVEIAHITMIGQNGIGVANLPEGTTVNAIRVSDFVSQTSVAGEAETQPCMVRPWRKPRTDWPSFEASVAEGGATRNMLRYYQDGQAAYSQWFEAAFGVSADVHQRNVFSAQHVLVGPVSADLQYHPLKGARVWVDVHDYVFAGTPEDIARRFESVRAEMAGDGNGQDAQSLEPQAAELTE